MSMVLAAFFFRPLMVFLCRTHVNAFESKMALEAEERSRELAEKVEAATFEQIQAQLTSDLEILRSKLPTKVSQAVETAQDMKYCRERQRIFVIVFEKCLILFPRKTALGDFGVCVVSM